MKRLDNGRYRVDLYPNGRAGKRIRKTFTSAAEARHFENWVRAQADREPWQKAPKDDRRLSALMEVWFDLHGNACIDGKAIKRKLLNLCRDLGDPIARTLTVQQYANYRKERLKTVKVRTVNNERLLLASMFNELIRLGEWQGNNPVKGIKNLRDKEPEMGFLTLEEIPRLLEACKQSRNKHLYLVVLVALSTGCRWNEAQTLKRNQIQNQRITFLKTKNGKHRTVPISAELFEQLRNHGTGERLFSVSITAFLTAKRHAGITLPKGQATHALRHTFASHFMMNGGNIIVLKSILGHGDLKQTMRYAHFSPSHLEDAVRLNPIAEIKHGVS